MDSQSLQHQLLEKQKEIERLERLVAAFVQYELSPSDQRLTAITRCVFELDGVKYALEPGESVYVLGPDLTHE